MLQRMLGVLKVDIAVIEAIEADERVTNQALLVVLLAGLLTGLGNGFWGLLFGDGFWPSFLNTLFWTIQGWLVWSGLTFFIGTRLFHGQATAGEMLRVLGFAHTPLLLGIIPWIGTFIGAAWALWVAFVAVRQGLDTDNFKALATITLGFVPYLLVVFALKWSFAFFVG